MFNIIPLFHATLRNTIIIVLFLSVLYIEFKNEDNDRKKHEQWQCGCLKNSMN